MNTTICLMAIRISETTAIRLSHMQQIVGSLVGIGTLCYFVFQRQKMPKLLGGSTRVLIWWMIAFVLMHNIFLCVVAIWHEVRFYIYSDGCDLLIRTWQCLFFRVPTITSIIGMSAVYMVLLIDRLCSIFLPNHYCNEKAPVAISIALPWDTGVLDTGRVRHARLTRSNGGFVSANSRPSAARMVALSVPTRGLRPLERWLCQCQLAAFGRSNGGIPRLNSRQQFGSHRE
ncbi:serpentine type 7TM GPCR chemoreceptor sra domain-containing protein [Ditylenchus destructor]|nr:serpentine type 7TM GPCR chemoreceptor sra domain-containing protein [Ditylenchus destructor]